MAKNELKVATRLGKMSPRDLVLLETNARFMRHEQFNRLVENVKRDGGLTSVPLAARISETDARYEVLSGNHRTMAAVEAGLESIDVMLIDEVLTKSQKKAIQLAHNAIAGEDDPAILQALYESIDDIDWREYSGLDDKVLDLLADVKVGSLSEANLDFQSLNITFLPEELDRVRETFDRAMALTTADERWIARYSQHERLLTAMSDASKSYDVSNSATALDLVLDVFEKHEHEIVDGWFDAETEKVNHGKYVPLGPVTGLYAPAEDAAVVLKAIRRAKMGDDGRGNATALVDICRAYLAD